MNEKFNINEIVCVSRCFPEWYGRIREIKQETYYVIEPTKECLEFGFLKREVPASHCRKLKEKQMDPKEKQAVQEAMLLVKLQDKLEEMLVVESGKKLFQGCKHAHLTEMVKVAHQVRSLLGDK